MIEGFIVVVAEAGPGTAAMWLAASLVVNAVLAALLLWLRILAKRLRFVRIPDHIRIVGATFYVPEGMCLELGDYVVLEGCDVMYGQLDITLEQGNEL